MANEKDLKKLNAEDMKNVDAGTVFAFREEVESPTTHKKRYVYSYSVVSCNEEGETVVLNFTNLEHAIDIDRTLFKKVNEVNFGGKVKVVKYGFQGPGSKEELFV